MPDQNAEVENEGQEPEEQQQGNVSVWDNPETARAEGERLRREAAANRVKAREATTAQAELEKLRQAALTDQERAIEEAKEAARAETRGEFTSILVQTEFGARLTARLGEDNAKEVDKILDGIDFSKFLSDDGKVNSKKVAEYVDRVAPANVPPRRFDIGQGNRGGTGRATNMNDLIREAAGVTS